MHHDSSRSFTPLLQGRPTQSSNHLRYTGLAAKIIHSLSSSTSLHCLNLVNIALIVRRPNCTGIFQYCMMISVIGSGHFVRLRWRNPLKEFALLTTFLTCSDQVKFLSIMMPKYLACSTCCSYIIM